MTAPAEAEAVALEANCPLCAAPALLAILGKGAPGVTLRPFVNNLKLSPTRLTAKSFTKHKGTFDCSRLKVTLFKFQFD